MSEDLIKVNSESSLEDLEKQLLVETDIDEINSIINLFNLNIKKKEIVRSGKLSKLQDRISDQMTERLDKHAGEFSNKDLLDYFKVIQDTLNKQDNSLEDIDTPAIQINQNNQVNINLNPEDNMSRDSKERVTSAIKAILSKYSKEGSIDESPLDYQSEFQDDVVEIVDNGGDDTNE